jgi:hypothetical protein
VRGKGWLLLGAFGLALLVNPYLACSSQSGSDFTYSEDEMKRAVLGTWQGSALIEGETVPFSLTLEQAQNAGKAPGAQPQCASRSFVKPAAACIALSRMPVVGALTSEHPGFNGAVDGELVAYRTLDEVELALHAESGAVLTGKLEEDAARDARIEGPLQGVFALQRP